MVNIPYRSAIGSLMYLSTCTRPDISAAVSELSKFSQNLGTAHWEGVKRVMRYVSGTVVEGLLSKRGFKLRYGVTQTRVMLEKGKLRGVALVIFFSVLEQQFHGEAQ